MKKYRDRHEAGQVLAEAIKDMGLPPDPVVIGLPRGGVTCAAPVAAVLGVRLNVLLVRKLGLPTHPELAFGAVASGGFQVLNRAVSASLSADDIARVGARERRELKRRTTAYGVELPALAGRVVVVVDDGLATGATMQVALEAIRSQGPVEVIVAVPVAAPEAVTRIDALADRVVCPLVPPSFRSVGEYYDDFVQVTDDEVIRLLASR